MRITLLAVLGFLAVAALLVYAGYELHRTIQEKGRPQPNPEPPMNP
jgi:hypothetical protein